jgi:spermidine synthase
MTDLRPFSREGWSSAVRLAGISFVILFVELALIRYVPGYVRVFGFYLNFVLIATFLGMGVGLLRAHQVDRVQWLAIPVLLALFGVIKYFANVVVQAPADADEFLWGVFFEIPRTVRRVGILPVATLLFTLCALVFVPLGAQLGREFRKFPPLEAYSLDIGGSLLGILAFGVVSALRFPPLVWFTVGFGVWVVLSLPWRRFAISLGTAGAVCLGLIAWTAGPKPEYWSPYYRINVFGLERALSINVNGSFHQFALNFHPAVVEQDEFLRWARRDYLRPYTLASRIDTVLVLGAGSGNDVALLLQLGAAHVDAVEIDPSILAIGKAAHFQQPYDDPRVHAHVEDARAFLRRTSQRYDVIVLGTLDSQTLLSGMSSLRLDNYVYTLEAFASARDRLKDDGHLITYHMSHKPWIAAKIYRALTEAFGREPQAYYERDFRLFNYTFVAGPNAAAEAGGDLPDGVYADVPMARDDWPYLYVARRTVPQHYIWALVAVVIIARLMVGWAAGRHLRQGFDGAMFFMGAGFLLVETKSVTEMSLLFGSTWTVNLLVFSSILAVILLANLLVLQGQPRRVEPLFAALFGALLVAYVVPVRALLFLGTLGQWLVGGLLVAAPIFFAAMIFATLFRTRKAGTRALAYNLLGAIVGGVLEYSSMAFGIKALYLIAAGAYLLALWYARRGAAAVVPVAAA